MTNPTACRELFEKWCEEVGMDATRAKARNGYDHIDTHNHWNTWRAAWNTRPTEGEAVAWQFRNVTEEGPSPFWHDIDKAKFDVLRNDPCAEVRELFDHPRATSDEVERMKALADRWRERYTHTDAGYELVECADELEAAMKELVP